MGAAVTAAVLGVLMGLCLFGAFVAHRRHEPALVRRLVLTAVCVLAGAAAADVIVWVIG